MKIVEIAYGGIIFDNGNELLDNYIPSWCKVNYVDWKCLEKELNGIIFDIDFDENLVFKKNDYGLFFGNPGKMFFVPCYSERNDGCSTAVDIFYKDSAAKKLVLSVDSKARD